MAGGIIHSAIAAHSPRMGVEEKAPDFVKGLIKGAYEMGERIRADKPDVIVVNSAHWVTTFMWYVTCQARHKGVVIADEAPDLIPGVPYERKGDPEFARALVEEINAAGFPCRPNESPHYTWDYGSWVPVKYMDPEGRIPVVLTGTVPLADNAECMAVGAAVRRTAEKTGKRAVVVCSSSLTHKIVRGPDKWPLQSHMELDFKFMDMLKQGRIGEAKEWFPRYTKDVVGEMGGRNVAFMLGAIDEAKGRWRGEQYGPYGQSSGSGNCNLTVFPTGQ